MALQPREIETLTQALGTRAIAPLLANPTLENLLQMLALDTTSHASMASLGLNLPKLRKELDLLIEASEGSLAAAGQLSHLDRVLRSARAYVDQLGRPNVVGIDLLLAIFDVPESPATRLLVEYNLSRAQVLGHLRRSWQPPEDVVKYLPKIGELVEGTIVDQDSERAIVELDESRASLCRDLSLPMEDLAVGDRISGILFKINPEAEQPRLHITRTSKRMVVELFKREVSEMCDGIVEIKSVARLPGRITKIAVQSNEEAIDPVITCVGKESCRVQAVSRELRGERIDIVPYTDDPVLLVTRALAPAQVDSVFMDRRDHQIYVVFPREDTASFAYDALNVDLASELTGWKIRVLGHEDIARYAQSYSTRTFIIGEWLVRPDRNILCRGNEEIPLRRKSMNVLIHLADNAPEVVDSADLIRRHWSRTDDGANALHRTIAHLRKVFNDSAKNPAYIVTVPKRGYRILAPVKRTVDGE